MKRHFICYVKDFIDIYRSIKVSKIMMQAVKWRQKITNLIQIEGTKRSRRIPKITLIEAIKKDMLIKEMIEIKILD